MFPPEGPHLERPQGDGGATYVNIPVSPTSKKQLNYMELQEPGSRMSTSHPSSQSKNASRLTLGLASLRCLFTDLQFRFHLVPGGLFSGN